MRLGGGHDQLAPNFRSGNSTIRGSVDSLKRGVAETLTLLPRAGGRKVAR
jgi:hypothetical protein